MSDSQTVSIVPDGVVAYGIQLPIQSLSTRVSMEWEREGGTIEDMAQVAEACDRAGFLYVAACHHVAIPPEPAEAMSTTWFDPVATLGYLAARTHTTRLMTNVYVASYRHPLETAKAFATVDALSNGRLLFGVGAGHVEGEFDALDVPFRERGVITDEAIDAILGAWSDEFSHHDGSRWKYAEVGQRPRPVQQPHPPIWIGGSGKPALRRVARVGDGWIPQATPPDRLAEDIEYILRERDRVRPGAVPEIGYHAGAFLGEATWDVPKFAMRGNERIIDWINKLGAIGVSHVQVRFAARSASELCDQVTAFGEEIGPHLTRCARLIRRLMPFLCMRHDFRAPKFGPARAPEIYSTALEQFVWADRNGFDLLVLSEHHGIDDGWMPAPMTMAGVVLGRTERARVMVSAAVLPLHDPVRMAEQIAVLDNASPGRLWVVVGAGYRTEEFEMAGADHKGRGKTLEAYVEVMKKAWTGEPFEWEGRSITVTPKPATQPHPMVLVGGGVPAAARRAARLRLPMLPMNTDQVVRDAYEEESKRVGYRGFLVETTGPTFVHVAEDPEKAWAEIAPYVMYDVQTYASYQTPGQHSTPGVRADSIDDLRRSPQFVVGTPAEVRARLEEVPADGSITFSPLAGGLPPDLAWASLELFAAEVLPHLKSPSRGQ